MPKSITNITIQQTVVAADWTLEIDVVWLVASFVLVMIVATLVAAFTGLWAKEVCK